MIQYLLRLQKRSSTEIDGRRQLKVTHRSAANDRLTPPLPKEVTVRAPLVNGYKGSSSVWADVTSPGANRTILKQAKEALFEYYELCILMHWL